jgi:hypothetical protein
MRQVKTSLPALYYEDREQDAAPRTPPSTSHKQPSRQEQGERSWEEHSLEDLLSALQPCRVSVDGASGLFGSPDIYALG